jgi:thiamine phosphate synthase YjbQ (UPF0047 family)
MSRIYIKLLASSDESLVATRSLFGIKYLGSFVTSVVTKSIQTMTVIKVSTLATLLILGLPLMAVNGFARLHGISIAPSKTLFLATALASIGEPVCDYKLVTIRTSQPGPPRQKISVEDLTPKLKQLLQESGMKNGVLTVISRHTTTAICINERESRLAQDMEKYFLSLAPPDERSDAETATPGVRYFHNDIDQRPDGKEEAQRCRDNGWKIDDPDELRKWRAQEPINAHSHLLSMLVGSSESIPVDDGNMVIGQWQSVLLVDLDGPRDRTVGVQLLGYR